MKRIASIFLALTLMAATLQGCARDELTKAGSKPSVVCTIFPLYDWTRQILGEKSDETDLTLLLNNRIDLHSYQPSVDSIARISTCDLFVYVGGESDGWVDDVLEEAMNKNMIVINLLDVLGDSAKEEELLEGMEEEPGGDGAEDEEPEYDEHIWLSLKNAQVFCAAIADALCSLDSAAAGEYRNNLDVYSAKLRALDLEYHAAVEAAPVKTMLFCDRFPFRYLTEDYGITPYAAFSGCSAETEASFDTIVFLAKKTDELNLRTVIVTESADQSIARTVINNTASKDQRILVMDAMQSITPGDLQNGATYLSIMESNLNVLKEALGA